MGVVDILVPAGDIRRWHAVLAARLAEAGHDTALCGVEAPMLPPVLDHVLSLERGLVGGNADSLAARAENASSTPRREDAALSIDLTGTGNAARSPALTPLFAGSFSCAEAARVLMAGGLPDVEVLLDGTKVGHAAPMIDSRVSVARGLDDVLARAMTLLVDAAERFMAGHLATSPAPAAEAARPLAAEGRGMAGTYVLSALPRQLSAMCRRMVVYPFHWRVGYRFRGETNVAGSGLMAGEPWRVLPDDGQRFYADPFPFEWKGRHFVFVEELNHATCKGVISVAEVFRDGEPSVPRVVLEDAHHLSYPQVFARDGEIWMLPEGAAGGALTLYRAEKFPDRWVRHQVLIADCELFDATLLDHGGRLWLFATARDGYGSASDTLVVYHAPSLLGPWTPHPANPVRIDRAAARPGGGFVRVRDRLVLPVQDGTAGYGGGLGLSDVVALDETTVKLTIPVPVLASADWPYPKIHTLNMNEALETVDGIAPSRKRLFGRAA